VRDCTAARMTARRPLLERCAESAAAGGTQSEPRDEQGTTRSKVHCTGWTVESSRAAVGARPRSFSTSARPPAAVVSARWCRAVWWTWSSAAPHSRRRRTEGPCAGNTAASRRTVRVLMSLASKSQGQRGERERGRGESRPAQSEAKGGWTIADSPAKRSGWSRRRPLRGNE
jgi:hypothetical protein